MGFNAQLRPVADPDPVYDGEGNVVGYWNWVMLDGAGEPLARYCSAGSPPLGMAKATLYVDQGYPEGNWDIDGDGYCFGVKEGS